MNQVLLIASIAAFVVAAFLHIRGCVQFPQYGQLEGNPLFRDKYGFFAFHKYLVSLAIFFGVSVLVAWAIGNVWQVWIPIAIMAGGQFVFWIINSADAKTRRNIQVDMLTRLREQAAAGNTDPENATIISIFNPKMPGKAAPANPTVAKAGRVWYRLFPWLWVNAMPGDPMTSQMAAAVPLREKVIAWSQRTPTEWFKV